MEFTSDDEKTFVKQLVNRLDDTSSTERLYSLNELQNNARLYPRIVGDLAIPKIFSFLLDRKSVV